MRSFDDGVAAIRRVPGSVVRDLGRADLGRGREAVHAAQLPALLGQLADRARIQSVKASSALEGVVVPDEHRADRIIAGGTARLRTRSEQELAGYRDALDYVWRDQWRPLNTGLVLHLHRLLLGHTPTPGGGLKSEDNVVVVDRLPGGGHQIRFRPVPARDTPFFTRELLDRHLLEAEADRHHPLLLIGLTVLDLLVIHPFEDGNGRVARVLTNALLADAGYGVARYVSLEQLIADTDEAYYATLLASTHGWHTGDHDPWPWLGYFVGRVMAAYEVFERRTASATGVASGKRDRVKHHVLEQAPPSFTIADIRAALPGISDGTIRNALDDLRRDGRTRADGVGRGATWTRL